MCGADSWMTIIGSPPCIPSLLTTLFEHPKQDHYNTQPLLRAPGYPQPIIFMNRLCATLADMQKPADDPILKRFRATLDELYGQRLERVVLYGSPGRGRGGGIRLRPGRCFRR